ncbi:MAG TPA: VWA domain-containing protein [Vicinamibacterales bacterium]|nr:VWA domain-containing protein [Vicinamibacterales bacterium]
MTSGVVSGRSGNSSCHFAVALSLASLVLVSAQDQQPVFRGGTDLVSVPVSVRTVEKAVAGLKASDFELKDNGVVQSIESFAVETLPIDVTLLLDLSRSVDGQRLDRLKYSVGETALLLDSDDRHRLIAVQHELHEVFPFQPGGSKPNVDSLKAFGGTALYDGLAAAMMRAAEPGRRQLIVAYTDGQDTISILPIDTVREIAGFADAVVQIVVPTIRGPKSTGMASVPGAALLSDLATRTGGQLFWMDIAAPIGDAFKNAIEDFRTSYVLRYSPKGVTRAGWHDLSVRVTSGTYEVRARKGYSGG